MSINWDVLQARKQELLVRLSDLNIENKDRHELQKELSRLTNLLQKHEKIDDLERQLKEAQTQRTQSSDPEMTELFTQEIAEFRQSLEKHNQELEDILYPPSEHDNRSVFLEIRSGAGGKEASLFVADLLKMYMGYAQRKNWRATVDSSSTTDLGGFREVVLHIKGDNVYGHLKHESGVHRVQRVPATETAGRIHTSTATVAVLPEAEEVDVTIAPSDLRIDVFRASGAGGQHVNTTDSAVRITHIPTGVVVSCQDERSQHKNKAKAMKVLQSRILAAQVEQHEAAMSKERKELVGTGMRSEKVRTYNYPQNRVTDHQVEVTLKKLDMVMLGDFDEIIQALRAKDRESRKNKILVK
ncbi:MAG TPA: peptide chain release factor 1 [Candidatus Babeliales bacterium]|nr:peptide chain release factor 1 [Candidatus Babeliales bacterium]